jgi:hypothetical protein
MISVALKTVKSIELESISREVEVLKYFIAIILLKLTFQNC